MMNDFQQANRKGPSEPKFIGRAAQAAPANRFERLQIEDDYEQLATDDDLLASGRKLPTEYFVDDSQSIVVENNSPDIPFRYSVNPYRGCSHGCAYCYARPGHEYLGLNAGIDFETKVMVKQQAPRLFRDFLGRKQWQAETVVFSGVTDCYQPAERQFGLTRGCLQVAAEARQPIGLITKNALVTRDLDLLTELAKYDAVHVFVSITTLDAELARHLEPRTSTPTARLRAVEALRDAGIPTGVMVAPVIPGLTDTEIPAILQAVSAAGAIRANTLLLRLPLTVRPVFLAWLEENRPSQAQRIISRIKSCREGKLNDSQFGRRMRGSGPIAEQIRQTFDVFRRKHALDRSLPPLNASHFRPPPPVSGQLRLF
jgi:DNA repair photolyase